MREGEGQEEEKKGGEKGRWAAREQDARVKSYPSLSLAILPPSYITLFLMLCLLFSRFVLY